MHGQCFHKSQTKDVIVAQPAANVKINFLLYAVTTISPGLLGSHTYNVEPLVSVAVAICLYVVSSVSDLEN